MACRKGGVPVAAVGAHVVAYARRSICEVEEEDGESGRKVCRFIRGPIFAHVLLADEINRTPPKTQAALLQAMQEHAVTVGGDPMPLGAAFFVLATQHEAK